MRIFYPYGFLPFGLTYHQNKLLDSLSVNFNALIINNVIKVLSVLTISCIVFAYKEETRASMFYEKIYKSVLFEQFTEQTRQFIKVLLRGERYPGEYKNCKDSLEKIQKQLLWEEKRSDYNISVSAPGKLSISINKP